ncbi:MAG TPA: zf-HC2 domain-containing protein [Terriglobales bacterium]|jgi:anti-sigma factor RsiW|nr:zf-HC2 domain-containing protein [Terriglobales bacterium]
MICDRAGAVVHGYFDNELDAAGAAEFERHLEQCSDCVYALEDMEALRSSMGLAQLYERAPTSLRKNIVASLGSERPVPAVPSRTAWRWLAVAAAILLIAYASWRATSVGWSGSYDGVLAAEIVDAHLRSLQPGHLTDVISTDQHTVKPWFDGKLDFSPPVQDFGDQGFPLQGGRIDVVHGQTVAALVYVRREHFVNVFIWPAGEKDRAPSSGSQQGYQWLEWRKAGMEFCVVSDAPKPSLEQLQTLLASN